MIRRDCSCTCNDPSGPVGGTGCGQREWRAADGWGEGRVHGHHVATGECHRAVREARGLFHSPHTHHCQQRHAGFKMHLKHTAEFNTVKINSISDMHVTSNPTFFIQVKKQMESDV